MTADPNGLDIIDMATTIITAQLHRSIAVQATRWRDGPDACPEYGPDLRPMAVARRAVGELLKAGMLVTPATPAEVDAIRRRAGGGT